MKDVISARDMILGPLGDAHGSIASVSLHYGRRVRMDPAIDSDIILRLFMTYTSKFTWK